MQFDVSSQELQKKMKVDVPATDNSSGIQKNMEVDIPAIPGDPIPNTLDEADQYLSPGQCEAAPTGQKVATCVFKH